MHPMDRSRGIARFEEIPRLNFGHWPTPIEKMPRLRAALGGGPKLYIKRDDYSGPGFGGNKVRKLEYVLAAAQQQGVDTVITCGGEKSNHCRVTAAFAARLGLECVLVLNRAAVSHPKPASLAVDEWLGARIERVDDRRRRASRMEEVAEELRRAGRNPLVIPLGASTPLGAMGFVSAAAELAAQMAARELRFDAIFFSSSSGGTHAGLAAGKELFLPPDMDLVGISPDDPSESIEAVVRSIFNGIAERLCTEMDAGICVLDQFVGEGYGIESEAGREALQLAARSEGLFLDPVYTAKAMAGMIAQIRQGKFREGQSILFWHTGGQLALFHE